MIALICIGLVLIVILDWFDPPNHGLRCLA